MAATIQERDRFITPEWRDALMERLMRTAKHRLLSRRADLQRLTEEAETEAREASLPAEGDDADRADRSITLKMIDALSEKEQRELRDVERALRSMEDGEWGTCTRCNGPIGLQRLNALPEVQLCIRCASE